MLSIVENKKNVRLDTSGNTRVKSRFGEFDVDLTKAIYFPKGILGFAPDLYFALLNFPKPEMSQFKILQCLNDHSVSLPVVPYAYENPFIEAKDMEELLKTFEVKKEDFLMLFTATSVKKPNGGFEVFINIKAPIVIDSKLQIGIQHVFTNNKYSVRQVV